MPGTARAAVEIALLGSASNLLAPWSAWSRVDTGCKGIKNRVESLYYIVLTADHQAVAPLESPDTPTRPNVEIMNTMLCEFGCAPDIIVVIRIATVNDDITGSEEGNKFS